MSFITVTDQIGRLVRVPKLPQRIVSLVPSQTELLYDLGLGDRVVGVTMFCKHPVDAKEHATLIGGTKRFKFDKIAELKPDLIIGNKEENYKEGIEKLDEDYSVWVSDFETLDDSLRMIQQIGEYTGSRDKATALVDRISASFAALVPATCPVRAAYVIWRKPYMVVAGGTLINELMGRAGFSNVFGSRSRYPQISGEELTAAVPEVVLLSSEPYPFKQRHVDEFQALCPGAQILLVDGEMFSWGGSRLRYSVDYFRELRTRMTLK